MDEKRLLRPAPDRALSHSPHRRIDRLFAGIAKLSDSVAAERSAFAAFVAYNLFLGAILLTNIKLLPNYLFIGVVLPLILFPGIWVTTRYDRPMANWVVSITLSRGDVLFAARRSIIFWAAVTYLSMMCISAAYQPDANQLWVRNHALLALEIVAFLCVTATLAIVCRNFINDLFTVMCPVVALSASINMIAFALNEPVPARLDYYRLMPFLGMPEYLNATPIAIIYASFFVAAFAIVPHIARSGLRRTLLLSSAGILLIAIFWTQARSAYIAVASALLVIWGGASRVARWAIFSAVIGFGALVLAVPAVRSVILSRGSSYRFETWIKYLSAAVERPWLGYGPWSTIDIKMNDGTVILHPHNVVFAGQIRGGLLAAIAMSTIILGGIYWGWRYWRQQRNAAPLCIMIVIATASMFDYELVVTRPNWPWITFWLPIGVCIGAEMLARGGRAAVVGETSPGIDRTA